MCPFSSNTTASHLSFPSWAATIASFLVALLSVSALAITEIILLQHELLAALQRLLPAPWKHPKLSCLWPRPLVCLLLECQLPSPLWALAHVIPCACAVFLPLPRLLDLFSECPRSTRGVSGTVLAVFRVSWRSLDQMPTQGCNSELRMQWRRRTQSPNLATWKGSPEEGTDAVG